MFLAGETLDSIYSEWIRKQTAAFGGLGGDCISVLRVLSDEEVRDYLQISFHTVCIISALEAKLKGSELHNLNIHLLSVFKDKRHELQSLINIIRGVPYAGGREGQVPVYRH